MRCGMEIRLTERVMHTLLNAKKSVNNARNLTIFRFYATGYERLETCVVTPDHIQCLVKGAEQSPIPEVHKPSSTGFSVRTNDLTVQSETQQLS